MNTYFYNYMAMEAPLDSQAFVNRYGMTPSNDPLALAEQLQEIVVQGGDPALKQLALIHPDKELLFQTNSFSGANNFSNASGNCGSYQNCGGCSGGYSSANGQSIKSELDRAINGTKRDNTELLIIGGVVLISLALIFKGK
jgi:hypothetical protein